MQKQLIVVGGGAAGFFCAVNAARFNSAIKVIVLEKSGKILSKVKVSGGGRCNVTHACNSIAEMVKAYPRGANFVKKSFHQFFTSDTIEWFEERGVKLKTEPDGRMFPVTDSSQTIIDCLLQECNKFGVKVTTNAEVKRIDPSGDQFNIQLADSQVITADFVCVACGGYPKAGMFEWITRLSHTIEEPVPSLFTFNMPGNSIVHLMGVVAEFVSIKIQGTRLEETGPVLITHWGLSGPAILKLSAWGARELFQRAYEFIININWVPAFNEQTLRSEFQQLRFRMAAKKMVNGNAFNLPQRLWEYLLEVSGINPQIRWADLPAKEQNKLIKNLCSQQFDIKGKTTFKEEFVTSGGIQLSEVDAQTMMSRIIPNLFFAGEILNVDGVTGGFNFQNAWTTGYIAAKSIAAL